MLVHSKSFYNRLRSHFYEYVAPVSNVDSNYSKIEMIVLWLESSLIVKQIAITTTWQLNTIVKYHKVVNWEKFRDCSTYAYEKFRECHTGNFFIQDLTCINMI